MYFLAYISYKNLMLIFYADVILDSKYVRGNSLMSGTRCTLGVGENFHICLMESLKGEDIPLDVETSIIITTISGEISLLELKKDVQFILYRGIEVGRGYVKELKEIYIEKKYLEVIKEPWLLQKIVNYAEQLPNAIVYEDVYDLIE